MSSSVLLHNGWTQLPDTWEDKVWSTTRTRDRTSWWQGSTFSMEVQTPTSVSQRSESGEGIMGDTEGRERYVGVVSCFSGGLVSPMSSGGYSLTGRHDDALCLDITAKTVVFYESKKRKSKKTRKNEYRCDERLKTKDEGSTCLEYTVKTDVPTIIWQCELLFIIRVKRV